MMVDRHHRTMPPLYKNGRLFIPASDRVIAADAYNGTPLWNVEVPGSRRIGIGRDCGYMALADEALYVATGGVCLALDPQTGRQLKKHQVLKMPDGRPRDCGHGA